MNEYLAAGAHITDDLSTADAIVGEFAQLYLCMMYMYYEHAITNMQVHVLLPHTLITPTHTHRMLMNNVKAHHITCIVSLSLSPSQV